MRMRKINRKWENTTTEMTATMDSNFEGITKHYTFACNEYSENDKAYMDLKEYDAEGKMAAPEARIYYDGITPYTIFARVATISNANTLNGKSDIKINGILIRKINS